MGRAGTFHNGIALKVAKAEVRFRPDVVDVQDQEPRTHQQAVHEMSIEQASGERKCPAPRSGRKQWDRLRAGVVQGLQLEQRVCEPLSGR